MGNKLKYLVIHCTATKQGVIVTSEMIKEWHTSPRGRGWSQVGYSDMIHLDGGIENLVPNNDDDIVDGWEITNGARGYNDKAKHVVYVGGLDNNGFSKDTRTEQQLKSLEYYVKEFHNDHREVKIIGHNEISHKACPCFNVKEWLKSIGIYQ